MRYQQKIVGGYILARPVYNDDAWMFMYLFIFFYLFNPQLDANKNIKQ